MKKMFFVTLIVLHCGFAYAQIPKNVVKIFIEANKSLGSKLRLVNKLGRLEDFKKHEISPVGVYYMEEITFVYHKDWLEIKSTLSSRNKFALLIRYSNIAYMKAHENTGITFFLMI